MKAIITFSLLTLSLFFTMPLSAQSQAQTGTITGTVSDHQSPPLFINVCTGKSVHSTPTIDADLVIIANEDISAIEEIEVITGAYDVRYEPLIVADRIQNKNELGRFTVSGHPNGSYQIIFKADDDQSTTEGRQKNRRVEIKIIFN